MAQFFPGLAGTVPWPCGLGSGLPCDLALGRGMDYDYGCSYYYWDFHGKTHRTFGKPQEQEHGGLIGFCGSYPGKLTNIEHHHFFMGKRR